MSDYPSQGTPMDVEDHPAYNKPDATEKYAGDVVSFPASKATPIPGSVGTANAQSMANIAKNGPKSVDTTNLTVFRPK